LLLLWLVCTRTLPQAQHDQRVKDIKDLIDDLVRLRLGGETATDEMSEHIKHEIDALVRSVRRLPH
jgi:hypothetical protein